MATGNQPLFKLTNKTLAYGEAYILNDLNLTIRRGERIALIGRSGSGKSTLLKHLRSLSPELVTWCPQNPALVPMFSTFHNIYAGCLSEHSFAYNLLNLIRPQSKALEVVRDIARSLSIEEYLKTPVEHMSGGQQQRVGLGRALIQKSPVFLGDEPVSAVDEYQAGELIRLISREYQTSVIALHDVSLALEYATRVVGLSEGRIWLDVDVSTASSEQIAALYTEADE
ncbi:ATP-binding cassette domain-containing protein [Parendozoicomonas sp. Alg238-R29]|uniref:ATP-binding cassette domain-containing protein n=1 Tax=Parendozoicomonas sp. Alg238-R29 TaxID=2993446 RepID=UPI00248ED444|nr:ATP-binding cassette domain-containing protein [Parendozoicomonas sp. Alg238-R29]